MDRPAGAVKHVKRCNTQARYDGSWKPRSHTAQRPNNAPNNAPNYRFSAASGQRNQMNGLILGWTCPPHAPPGLGWPSLCVCVKSVEEDRTHAANNATGHAAPPCRRGREPSPLCGIRRRIDAGCVLPSRSIPQIRRDVDRREAIAWCAGRGGAGWASICRGLWRGNPGSIVEALVAAERMVRYHRRFFVCVTQSIHNNPTHTQDAGGTTFSGAAASRCGVLRRGARRPAAVVGEKQRSNEGPHGPSIIDATRASFLAYAKRRQLLGRPGGGCTCRAGADGRRRPLTGSFDRPWWRQMGAPWPR